MTSDTRLAILFALILSPGVLAVVVALLRGYSITVVIERRRARHRDGGE